MRPKLTIDRAKFERAIARYVALTKTSAATQLRRHAAILCLGLAKRARPPGVSGATRKSIQAAIAGDVLRAWGDNQGDKVAREQLGSRAALYSSLKLSDPKRAERLLQKYAPQSTAEKAVTIEEHNRLRKRGRVYRGAGTIAKPGQRKTLTNEIKKKIGVLKSGWFDCVQKLGATARGWPVWLRNHNKGGGMVTDRTQSSLPSVSVENTIEKAAHIISGPDVRAEEAWAMSRFIKALQAEVRAIENRLRA